MKREIQFLQVSKYTHLDEFIQHITDLRRVPLTYTTTTRQALEILKSNEPGLSKVISEWLDLQDSEFLDMRLYYMFEIDLEATDIYIHFNIYKALAL